MLVLKPNGNTKALKKYLPQIVVVFLSVLILYIALGDMLFAPNRYMFHNDGDGLKNYYTPAYYLRYDEGTTFTGMNYPFGEHVVFTDNQPIISFIINWIDNHLFEIWPYTIGLFNFLLIISIPISALLLYLIGRHYYLPKAYAILIALLITFLSPQMYRLTGHYALAYGCFVPLVWFILIRLNHAKKPILWWGIWIGTVFLFGMIHVYYILMGVIMTMAYQLLTHLIYTEKGRWKQIGISLALALIPLILFKVFLSLTDGVNDRPESPYGFYNYKAYWESLWMPPYGPVRNLIQEFIEVRNVPGESIAYVGFWGFLVAIFSIVRLVKWGIKKRFRKFIKPALPARLGTATWAGLLVLFFSMGIPFTWGMDFLLDLLTPLKQFRSLGRFAWVPYYMFSMYAAVYLYLVYRLFKQKHLKIIGGWVLGIALVLWAWESSIHIKARIHYLGQQKLANLFVEPSIDYNKWLAEHDLSADDFQAILTVPAYFIGSEKFIPQFPHPEATRHSFMASFQTGLPIASGMMSRTSLSQSLQLVQIMSNDLLEKEVLKKYESDKPLLVISLKDVALTVNDQRLVPKADLIDEKGMIQLMRLDLDKLRSKKEEIFAQWKTQQDSLVALSNGLFATTDTVAIAYKTFDQKENSFFGEETLQDDEGPITIMDEVLPKVIPGEWMQWSLYVKADGKRDAFPVIIFRELDLNGKVVQQAELNPKFGMNIYEDWVLLEHEFKMQNAQHKINIYTAGTFPEVESLLVRPLDVDVYKPRASGRDLMFNNYYFMR